MLVERHGLRPADAFQRIRMQARSANRRVHDVATDIVAGRAR